MSELAKKYWFGYPRGLATLFYTEMWERFSYYGMRALLILFMTGAAAEGGLAFDEAKAGAIYGLYTAGVYLLTLPGGWLADKIIGQRKAIWYGGIIIACGHFTMAIPSITTFYIGLVLICVGTGLLKPNISTCVGELYPDGGEKRDAGFSVFYMGINVGAFLGPILCGIAAKEVNWHLGFALAGFGMILGLIQYRSTGKYLGEIGLKPNIDMDAIQSKGSNRLGAIIALACIGLITTLQLTGYIDLQSATGLAEAMGYIIVIITLSYFGYIIIAGGLKSHEIKKVVVIFFLFIGAATFWSGFEQAGSSLNLFAERYTQRNMGPFPGSNLLPAVLSLVAMVSLGYVFLKYIWNRLDLFSVEKLIFGGVTLFGIGFLAYVFFQVDNGWEMPAAWLQSVNSMFIIILAPMFGALWVHLTKRGLNPRTPVKFFFALIFLALGFFVMVFAAKIATQGMKASMFFLVLTYFLHTVGELSLSPVGLSTVTKLSPKRYVGQMMGIWFVGTAMGNLIAGTYAGNFDENNIMQMPDLFMMVVKISIGVGLIFLIASPLMKKWMDKVH